MPYTPSATDSAEPTISQTVQSAAQEFRTLKGYLQTQLGLIAADSVSQDGRLDLVETQLSAIALGTDSTALAANLVSTDSGKGLSMVGLNDAGNKLAATNGEAAIAELVGERPWINVKQYPYLAIGNGTTDDTAAIQAAITALGGAPGVIYFPPGTYKITGTVTVGGQGQLLLGSGTSATQLKFAPTADGTCLLFTASAAVQNFCGVRNLWLYSTDTTFAKVALEVRDNSMFVCENVRVSGEKIYSGSHYWGSDTPKFSTALLVKGREAGIYANLQFYADKPIRIAANPNSTAISCDHHVFRNLYLVGNVDPAAVAGTAYPIITIDDDLRISNLTFDGFQAWVGGTYGLYWQDTLSASISENIHIKNVRTEQVAGAGTYHVIYMNRTGADVYNVMFENFYCGAEAHGGTSTDRHGVFIRKAWALAFKNFVYSSASGTVLDVDATVHGFNWQGWTQAGSVASLAGQRLQFSTAKNPSTGALPPFAVYNESASTQRMVLTDESLCAATSLVLTTGTSDTTYIPANFVGLAQVNETSNNGQAVFLLGPGGISTIVAQNGSVFANTPTAAKIAISWTGTAWQVNNQVAATRTIYVTKLGRNP